MQGQSRIKDIPPDQRSPEQNEVIDKVTRGRGYLLTPFRIWIHAPDVAAGMEKLGASVTTGASLTRREREIAICMIANHWKGEYVWKNHVEHSLALGLPAEALEAIRAGTTPHLENQRERAVYELCVAAMQEGAGPDDVFDRSEKLLGRRGIAEVLAVLGYFGMVCMSLKLHRVPLPEREGPDAEGSS